MLDKGQSIMIPKNLEAQVLLKDHTLVEDREQENKLQSIGKCTEAETDETDTSQENNYFEDD